MLMVSVFVLCHHFLLYADYTTTSTDEVKVKQAFKSIGPKTT